MNTNNEFDSIMMHGQIAEALTPLTVPAERAARLQQRLAERIAQSAERHRGLRTVRDGDAPWQTLAKGVRARVLHDNGATRSAIVEFAPGAHLPSHRHATHEECIVLRGSLQAGDSHVGLHDYHLAPAGSRHASIQSAEGAVAFLRGTSIGNTRHMLRDVLTAALPGDGPALSTIAAGDDGWREVADGAFVKPLWVQGESAAMLLRLAAGARAPSHRHAVDEECLMLSGEVFFGDILLRDGEYQLAPRGTQQGEAYSEAGALLYLHGDAAYLRRG
jgi:quercetin dioxygenase-like cupin family protein